MRRVDDGKICVLNGDTQTHAFEETVVGGRGIRLDSRTSWLTRAVQKTAAAAI